MVILRTWIQVVNAYMKIELSFLVGLVLSASHMAFRVQIYGVEQALLSATAEDGIARAKRIQTYFLKTCTRIVSG
jgi:uncharacterized membrane protein